MKLLKTRRFAPLFVTQFLGAFNDNVFKNALVMFITYKLATQESGNAQILVTLAGALFILPYFLFSAMAGQFADKYDRARIARITKVWEMIVVAIAAIGLYIGHAYFMLFVLFCFGVQSTFFGPVKYTLLPQHLHEDELIAGNAYIEAGTFLAILLGTILGGVLIMAEGGEHLVVAAMVVVAVVGYIASRFIPLAPAPSPNLAIGYNIVHETWAMVSHDRQNRRVFLSILGISWFWLVGATFLALFPGYAKNTLLASESLVTLFLTIFSLGIGIGSFACTMLLKGEVKATLAPWAAIGMSIFTFDLVIASGSAIGGNPEALISAWQFLEHAANWRILFDMLMIAICGGIYVVPLYAIMQHDSAPESRARTIATNNVMNALFMVAAALVTVLMLKANFTVPQVFLALAVANGAVAFYCRKLTRPA